MATFTFDTHSIRLWDSLCEIRGLEEVALGLGRQVDVTQPMGEYFSDPRGGVVRKGSPRFLTVE